MSDIALVMVEATQARVGDIDIWPDDYHLFTENVQSDEVLIVRNPTEEERQRLFPTGHNFYHSDNNGQITEVVKPFWAFRLTPIGDWIGTFTDPVSDVVDSGGWDQFQEDVPELVKIAERIQHEDSKDNVPPDPCPIVTFVVAYKYAQDVISTEYGNEIGDSWCELLGEVDLDKVPQIIKRPK